LKNPSYRTNRHGKSKILVWFTHFGHLIVKCAVIQYMVTSSFPRLVWLRCTFVRLPMLGLWSMASH
jgi:hypothetical protein